jgi:AcrR family transcriptional regulator
MALNAPRKGVAVRSRPARRRAADTRARILAAGRRLFIDEGWAAFTTRRVAREAGVSLGSLQHFFPSKEQLLAGMLEDIIAAYGQQFAEMEAQLPQGGQERLLAAVQFLIDDIWRPESRKFFMNLFALSCHSVSAGRLLNEVYAHHRRRIAGYVATARPGLRERECLDLGLQIAGLIDGLMIYTAPDARAVSSRAQLAEMVRGAVLRLID